MMNILKLLWELPALENVSDISDQQQEPLRGRNGVSFLQRCDFNSPRTQTATAEKAEYITFHPSIELQVCEYEYISFLRHIYQETTGAVEYHT